MLELKEIAVKEATRDHLEHLANQVRKETVEQLVCEATTDEQAT